MTTWMITQYQTGAAPSRRAGQRLIADYATADDIDADRELFRGSPWLGDNRADYLAQSAITLRRAT